MAILKLNFLDFVLVATLSYLIYDVLDHSVDYSTCAQPINLWLLAVYITLILLRLTINVVVNSDRFCLVKCCRFTMLCCLLPFLIEWTIQGTIWYLDISRKTPDCIPSDRLPPLIIWWIFVCYVVVIILLGILIYELVWFVKKKRLRTLIQNYLNNEDPYRDLEYFNNLMDGADLSPDEIPLSKHELKKLDTRTFLNFSMLEHQCSICCEDTKNEEEIIKLFGCGHVFHKNCLEQWLSRKPLCPNCKRNVRTDILRICKNKSSFDKRNRNTTNCEEREMRNEEEEKV